MIMASGSSSIFGIFFMAFLLISVADTDLNGGFDHRAHAVPGGPYIVQDTDADGFAFVKLNGELSHSHYFNPSTGATGRIVSFQWFVGNSIVCEKVSCFVQFPLGKTILRLKVTDNTNDEASDDTYVDILKGYSNSVRLWFYPKVAWIGDDLSSRPRPVFSGNRNVLNMGPPAFPTFLESEIFNMRVLGNIDLFKEGNYRFKVDCGSLSCKFWIGNTLVISGENKKVYESNPMMFSSGRRPFHAIVRRTNLKHQPSFFLRWLPPGAKIWQLVPGNRLSHTPARYPPVIHAIKPTTVEVGSVIRIFGSSLLDVEAVSIENNLCLDPESRSQFLITCVVPNINGKMKASVKTRSGTSNTIPIAVVRDGNPPDGNEMKETNGELGYFQRVRFSKSFLKRGNKIWRGTQLTAITLGPDGRFYIGSLNGYVHVLGIDLGNQIKTYCRSPKVGKYRSILGVAFNPAELTGKLLYASTSVLFWKTKKLLKLNDGWANGEIISLKVNNQCLGEKKVVISGLPVSNYDHAVNGIIFDNSGNLLFTVGGSTNAGVSQQGDSLGGIPDSPLSGAMIFAPVLKKGFNGKIKYNQYQNPETANIIGGSVSLYAAGLRNSFSSLQHSNGHIYSTDNGANAKFGARSTGCNYQTGVSTELDKLNKIKKGGYYGYANRNRGRKDRKQCVYQTNQRSKTGYTKPIALMESSTSGIMEYTANTFGGQLRGNVILSKFAVSGNGKLFRVQLDSKGDVKSHIKMEDFSGLTSAMSITGGLLMPRVYQGKVATLLPMEKNPGILVVTSINPFRGPRRGGNTVTITGWNLKPPVVVKFGKRECTSPNNFSKGRQFTCIVPSGQGKVPVTVARFGKTSKSYGFEYVYMNV